MSAPVDVKQNPDGSWTAKGGISLTVVSVTAVTEKKAVSGHAIALSAIQLQGKSWIKCSDRLPEVGVTVLVYAPPQPDDWPDDVRISFDALDPDSDEPRWLVHGEHYEHFCCVALPEGSIGPSEQAPYTHWMPCPPIPTE